MSKCQSHHLFSLTNFLKYFTTSGVWLLAAMSSTAHSQGVDPAGFSTPATNTTGTYFVSWNSTVYPVVVYESKQGVSGEIPINSTPMLRANISVTRSNGLYTYRFYHCPSGSTSCSSLWGTRTTTVAISSASNSSASTDPKITRYTYDELGRLIKVEDGKNGNHNYKYDAAGNRTNITLGN